ncbi:MAG: response regulator [Pseudobdellovibrio sp.]
MSNSVVDWEKLTVLVVEDDDNLREVIVEMFQNKLCEVIEAENGAVALSILQSKDIDIVFSDIRMPVMDGIEMLKRIVAQNKEKPLVFLATGHSDINEKEVKKMGAVALMYKPFYCGDLISNLEKILVGIQTHPEIRAKINSSG